MGFMGIRDVGSVDHPAKDADYRGTEHGEAKDFETVSDGFSVRNRYGNWRVGRMSLARAQGEKQES